MRAVLAMEGFHSKKHFSVIAAFRERYVKAGIFSSEFPPMAYDAYEMCDKCDHDDFFVISKADVARQIENATTFLDAVEACVKTL